MNMMKCLDGPGCRVDLQADRMPGATEAMVFTDSYKHMECLSGMRLQSFLTLFTLATPGTPASLSILIKQVIVYLFVCLLPPWQRRLCFW